MDQVKEPLDEESTFTEIEILDAMSISWGG